MTTQTILITGCSSGIGRTTAKYFQERGWNVIATVRSKPDKDEELNALENVLVAELDVTVKRTIEDAIAAGIERFGKIDVVLNNAGYGSYGLLEATPEHKMRKQYDVNVIGPMLVMQSILPHFRKRGGGTIINISSMGGKITFPLGTLYHGSKFAVEGMSEALSHELGPIGVKIKLIEPGVINTNFAGSSFDMNVDPGLTEYNPLVEAVTKAFAAATGGSDPIVVAQAVWEAATDGSDQLRYIAGEDATQINAARKQMEDPEYLALVRSQMGL
ncbi:SDR family oxidoreductase [Stenotrophomonas maltophilia]|uniref:SDR family oxidoreductase n=1 Tax=Stenotrophomonas maltophilia TaxID=40324 RepID=UPI00066A1EE0|nr:SDR family oxidoreductase [Stenotrophomonas maltophilia]MBH1465387.1 SDR family oxidoreductase [Stenotrophomonas maltophilia]MBH1613413.1 SDR family oxidoreductase [Stenotrophomonas maltophilia]MBN5167364.1 SDR family oxidoreductase [Stenotrophomonas maltophilia]